MRFRAENNPRELRRRLEAMEAKHAKQEPRLPTIQELLQALTNQGVGDEFDELTRVGCIATFIFVAGDN